MIKKRAFVLLISFLLLLAVFVGSTQAGGDNNQNTHGEDGNYEDNNNNPYGDDDFPGDDSQERNGVVWP